MKPAPRRSSSLRLGALFLPVIGARQTLALQAKLEHLDGLQNVSASWDAGAYGAKVREALGDWQRLLGASPEVARQVL
ncbi:MAG: hypothetical protein LAO05_18250, partial [Acidobacteriia bacterium]|nr:hypothetical protein [Terriglobia bacterium]